MANAEMSKSDPKSGVSQMALIPEDDVKHIPLGDIFVDPDWNNRSINRTMSATSLHVEDEGTGIEGLKTGIFNDGQDEPVVLRETKDSFYKKNLKQRYALVAGFRRFEAIRQLNDNENLVKERDKLKMNVVPNTANGTIRAFVRNLSELEAIKLNLRENTQRDNLPTPDLVHGAWKLKHFHQMEPAAIANTLGKHTTYVILLLQVGTLPKEVLDHWRNGGEFRGVKSERPVTVKELQGIAKDIKESEKEARCIAYANLLKERSEDAAEGNQQYKAAKRRGIKFAGLIGRLARKEYGPEENKQFMNISTTVAWADVIEHVIGKTKLDARQRRRIADACEGAYTEALTKEEEEDTEEGEEEETE